MRIEGVDHVQITVSAADVEAARGFYCEVLGLREVEKPDSLKPNGGFWAATGDVVLHVGVEEGFDRLTTKGHVAYRVDDVWAWRDKLVGMGIEVKKSIEIPGYERFEFRDPFGNRVEMIRPIEGEKRAGL